MPSYTINDLAKLSGVTPRTIRYYVEQGLLPPPGQLGPGTPYSEEHLERLRLIKKLQASYLPLAEIRNRLRELTKEELTRVAEQAPAPAPGAASDYIANVLGRSAALPSMAPAAQPIQPTPTPPQQRSQWERIPLDPDIELHIRRPLTRQSNKRVERLIAIARELFEED